MLRILSFLLIVLAAALGFSWLQDHPGSVAVNFGGAVTETSFTVFVVAQLVLLAVVCFIVWLVRAFFRTPDRIGTFFSTRRRDKGYHALSAGIIAAGAGDAVLARRMTKRSSKYLASRREPLVRFLDAQTAMIEGDHDRARSTFESMERDPETRLLALRGLFLEAERLGDTRAARHYAERAVRIAPHVPWAGGAVLESKAIEGDYDGALAILEAQRDARLIEKAESTRMRAVLLTAKARTLAERDPAAAKTAALEAHSLAPGLTPAAVTAAQALFRLGDLKKGSKVLEKAWTEAPHPDIAAAYVHARPGDSTADRLKRARRLEELRPNNAESSLALAHAAMDAGDYALAREAALAASRADPRESVFLLLADIEEAQTGSEGRVREWLSRAVRAPRDPAWVADGIVAADWAPVSPDTGRLDAFEWKAPSRRLGGEGPTIEGEEAREKAQLATTPAAPAGIAADAPADPATGTQGPHAPASLAAADVSGERSSTDASPVDRAPDAAAADGSRFRLF